MIVVLDINVVISVLLSAKGPPAKVIDKWESDEFDIAVSNPLLDELEALDINTLSPIEAINRLYEWQKRFLGD